MALRSSKWRVSWKSSAPLPPPANIWLMMPTMRGACQKPQADAYNPRNQGVGGALEDEHLD